MAAGIPLQKIEKLKGSGYVRKAGTAGGQLGFASDNSTKIPKGRIRDLKFYYYPCEVACPVLHSSPKDFRNRLYLCLFDWGIFALYSSRKRSINFRKQSAVRGGDARFL